MYITIDNRESPPGSFPLDLLKCIRLFHFYLPFNLQFSSGFIGFKGLNCDCSIFVRARWSLLENTRHAKIHYNPENSNGRPVYIHFAIGIFQLPIYYSIFWSYFYSQLYSKPESNIFKHLLLGYCGGLMSHIILADWIVMFGRP